MRNSLRMLLLLVASSLATLAHAATSTLSGTITATPEMPVVFISTPNCTAQGASLVNYHMQPFTVSIGGSYQVSVTSVTGTLPPDQASIYIYQDAFDPANGMTNCIAGANNDPATIPALALTAGTPYFLVVFDDTFEQLTETTPARYVVTFDGPGVAVGAVTATATPVPTLSDLSLLLLGTLLAGGAAIRHRTRTART